MLLASPEECAAVFDGPVVTASAQALFVELLRKLGGEESRLKEDAVPDVAEGTFLLVESGLGEDARRKQEKSSERRKEAEETDQGAWYRGVNRRFPA